MAQVANTRKVFNFQIEIDGVNQFEVQKVTVPTPEVEAVEHGDTNHSVKTAGRIKVEDMVFEKLRPLPTTDTWAWDWLKRAQDFDNGGGELPENYKKQVVIKEMSTNNTTTVNKWIADGVWPKKISQSDFDRMSSDNIIETITFSVDKVKRQ